jgi:hypothetical protein
MNRFENNSKNLWIEFFEAHIGQFITAAITIQLGISFLLLLGDNFGSPTPKISLEGQTACIEG